MVVLKSGINTKVINNKVLYFHINNISGEIFYVGIGSIKRASSKSGRSVFWNKIVNKYDYDIIIEEEGLTWNKACELEKYWINKIGRRDLDLGPLVNHTNGGDGTNGHITSDETKLKMSLAHKGKNIGRISHFKDCVHTDETKAKISLANTGKKRSDETKAKISFNTTILHTGKKRSEESKLKMSLSKKGKIRGPYNKNKINDK